MGSVDFKEGHEMKTQVGLSRRVIIIKSSLLGGQKALLILLTLTFLILRKCYQAMKLSKIFLGFIYLFVSVATNIFFHIRVAFSIKVK